MQSRSGWLLIQVACCHWDVSTYQSLCVARDGTDAMLKQKSDNFTNTLSLFKHLTFQFEYLHDQQGSYKCPKAMQKTAKHKSLR